MSHFVCPECGTQSKQSGVCQMDDCTNNGQPLRECNCEDGKHALVRNTQGGDEDTPKNETTIDLDSDSFS